MTRQIVFTSRAAKPSPTYSQAVKAAGLIFVSGTAPTDPDTGQIKGITIQEQTQQCLISIAAILEAAGSSLEKIASATVILADEDDFAGMNEEWMRWFQQIHLPAKAPNFRYVCRVSKYRLPLSLKLSQKPRHAGFCDCTFEHSLMTLCASMDDIRPMRSFRDPRSELRG